MNHTRLQYNTRHYTTLRYNTPHFAAAHWATMHCNTPRYTTLHYATLHYATLHHTTTHYTTPHHITPHYSALHYPTLHYTNLHYITLHYMPLRYARPPSEEVTIATYCNHCNHQKKYHLSVHHLDSLCHPLFTTTKFSYRFPVLKLPPPPCAVLLKVSVYSAVLELAYALPKQKQFQLAQASLW